MKKTFSIITTVLLVVFLISALVTIVGCMPSTGDAAKNETENQKKDETQNDKKDGLIIPITQVWVWNEQDGSFDAASGKVILKNGSKGASIGIDAVDASEYKYVKLVYEKLDFPNIIFRVHYEDESLSEVFLQKK